jgi:hypothetical protein
MTSPTNPIARLDVPLEQVAAEAERLWAERDRRIAVLHIRQQFARRVEPQEPECAHCGDRQGPLVPEPHDARYSNWAQVLVCKGRCTAADPDRHDIDRVDTFFASTAASFPAPATDADYAGTPWAARLDARIAETQAAWAAAHTKTAGGTA